MMILVRKIEDHRETNTKTRSRALVVKSKPVTEMKIEKIFTRVQLLQKLLDRFLACHPTCNTLINYFQLTCLLLARQGSFTTTLNFLD